MQGIHQEVRRPHLLHSFFIFSQKPEQSVQHLEWNYLCSWQLGCVTIFWLLCVLDLKSFGAELSLRAEWLVFLLLRCHHFSTAIHLCVCCQATPDTLGMWSECGSSRGISMLFCTKHLVSVSSALMLSNWNESWSHSECGDDAKFIFTIRWLICSLKVYSTLLLCNTTLQPHLDSLQEQEWWVFVISDRIILIQGFRIFQSKLYIL